MSLSVLEIEKGADELVKSYDQKILELTALEQQLLKDKNVQLYVLLHEKIKNLKNKESIDLNDYFSSIKQNCNHPLYVCVANGMSSNYKYKCICVNCGEAKYFKKYEMDELYNNHRLIIEKIFEDTFNNSLDLFNYTDVVNYYKEMYNHLKGLSDTDDDSVEMATAEATFNHFMCKDKSKIIKKTL